MSGCLNCGVRAYSLTDEKPPKMFICGRCTKTLTPAEIIALTLDADEDEEEQE